MATKNDKNVFSSQWNDSDMVLVVEDQELHVHKWILKSQSPVFKAMFEGHFQEANQDKITLKEKKFESMVQFLKILYPSSMFEEAQTPLDDERRLSIMALAEEYQCVNLIKQCINVIKITPQNALHILPYAVKYHPTVLSKLYVIINWSAPTSKLGQVMPKLESKETSITMLLTKCRFLESGIIEMQDAMISLMYDFLNQKKMADDANASIQTMRNNKNFSSLMYHTSFSDVATSSRCPHKINIREINKTKSCVHCKENYKEKFITPIPSRKDAQTFFNMLQRGDDVATAVKEQK
jgi:hypothetical protein